MARYETAQNNDGDGYDVGDVARLTVRPVDDNGTPIDPSTISVSILLPDGTTVGPFTYAASAISRHASYFVASDIVYRYLYTVTQSGWHTYTFTTGTPASVEVGSFDVR